jgi:hypothetical protein
MPDLPPDPIEPPFSDDEVWESLVARLTEDSPPDAESASPAGPAVADEADGEVDGEQAADPQERDDEGDDDPDPADEQGDLPAGGAAVLPATPIVVWRGSGGDSAETEREAEDFTPPDPPPLPRTDVFTTAAWAGALGGPGLLLTAGLLGWQVPGWLAVLAVVAFLGGGGILVARMRNEPPDDDGAVV